MKTMSLPILAALAAAAALGSPGAAPALSTAFTYQGRVVLDGSPVSDSCDFQFMLFDGASGGVQIGSLVDASGVAVDDGLFTVKLDFGAVAFTGADRWLGIDLRCPSGSGAFTSLDPRQQLAASPYALHATNAANVTCVGCVGTAEIAPGAVASDDIANGTIQKEDLGFVPGTVLDVTAGQGLTGGIITSSGTIAVDFGGGSTQVAAGDHRHDSDYWRLGGNYAMQEGLNILGTRTNQGLELRVNNTRALRIDPGSGAPNIVFGHPDNFYSPGLSGLTISGGGGVAAGHFVQGDYGTIGGGRNNMAAASATVGGGELNAGQAFATTVAGGKDNGASEPYSTIGGGSGNRAAAEGATIAGGVGNRTDGPRATVGGGRDNTAGGESSTVAGGWSNLTLEDYATVAGGKDNFVRGAYGVVGGGWNNLVAAAYATVAGGGPGDPNSPTSANRVTDDYGAIGGGGTNTAGSDDGDPTNAVGATVAGGGANTASGPHSTVTGGFLNTASGPQAAVLGGTLNTASGSTSVVAGGILNSAEQPGSFAAGTNAHARHGNAFVWSDGSRDFGSTAANQFAALATGGFRLYMDGAGNYCELTSTAGWLCTAPSDRNVKKDFAQVDTHDVLERLSAIPIRTWRYKTGDGDARHIGPVAQDFHAAFAVGRDERHIATVDADGVALAAIQRLYDLAKEKDRAIAELEERNRRLEERMSAIEASAVDRHPAREHHPPQFSDAFCSYRLR